MVNMSSTFDKTLANLGLSGGAIRIYTTLLTVREASAKRLAELSGLPRTSVYDYLRELGKKALVVELDIDNKKVFRPDNPKNLEALVDTKLRELESEKKSIKETLGDLTKVFAGGEPRIKFYSGKEGFIAVLADVARSGSKEALFFWPFSEMTDLIGEDNLRDFTARRVAEGMSVRSIWPVAAGAPHSKLRLQNETTRFVDVEKVKMGYIIYADKVAFISSRDEQFAFIVQSKDFSNLQKLQFETLWKISKKK